MNRLIALVAITLLAACTQVPPQESPPLNVKASPIFQVRIGEVRVEDNYQPRFSRPNVEHEFPTPPAKAITDWVHHRLQASGNGGVLVASIDEGSVREVVLPKKTGLTGLLEDQNARYDAKISATFRLYDGVNSLALAEASVQVARARTLKSNASPDERERFYAKLNDDLMREFDTQASRQLKQYFSAYLR